MEKKKKGFALKEYQFTSLREDVRTLQRRCLSIEGILKEIQIASVDASDPSEALPSSIQSNSERDQDASLGLDSEISDLKDLIQHLLSTQRAS